MTKHILAGVRPEPLASYLVGLGVIRVLGEQADPELTAWWDPAGLVVETTVDDLVSWFTDVFAPTPVLRAWNQGSDFGAVQEAPSPELRELLAIPDPRLDPYRATLGAAHEAARKAREGARPWVNEDVAREFRNLCPPQALAWLDAAVVLAGRELFYPPLLGTGGNDGRLDFAGNLHQHLATVFDPAPKARRRSAALIRDLFEGTQREALAGAAVGQFDPAAAGGRNSSPFGAAGSYVNPWTFVLMVEGAVVFASTANRRNLHTAGRAAIPFTVRESPEGSASGANEASRGEVWAPVWDRPFTHLEVRQLFSEARAAWRGKPAQQAVEFYAATRTLGVARGVSAFVRYGIHQRNGQAHVAVPIEVVRVANHPAVALAGAIEDWVRRARRGEAGAAIEQAGRRYDRAYIAFAKNGDPLALGRLLACVTDLEMAVGRNARARETVPVRRPPAAKKFLDFLASDPSPELRVAVGIASCRTLPGQAPERTMRHLLLPVDPGVTPQWRDSPVVAGLGLRPLPRLLAEVLAWRARTAPGEQAAQDDVSRLRGVRTFRHGIAVPGSDLHRLARGQLDAELLMMWLKAGLALDWRRTRHSWPAEALPTHPVPLLAMLHALGAGIAPTGGDGDEAMSLALEPDWPVRLAAGQLSEVHDEAASRLRQAGLRVAEAWYPGGDLSGVEIAAALVPKCLHPRRVLLSVVATPLRPTEEHDHQESSITDTDMEDVEPESEEETES